MTTAMRGPTHQRQGGLSPLLDLLMCVGKCLASNQAVQPEVQMLSLELAFDSYFPEMASAKLAQCEVFVGLHPVVEHEAVTWSCVA